VKALFLHVRKVNIIKMHDFHLAIAFGIWVLIIGLNKNDELKPNWLGGNANTCNMWNTMYSMACVVP